MAQKRQAEKCFYNLGLGGAKSRATQVWAKPWRACEPSQKGLFSEWPQRHREIAVLPASPNDRPVGSQISNSPSIRKGPLFKGVIFAAMVRIVTRDLGRHAELSRQCLSEAGFRPPEIRLGLQAQGWIVPVGRLLRF